MKELLWVEIPVFQNRYFYPYVYGIKKVSMYLYEIFIHRDISGKQLRHR